MPNFDEYTYKARILPALVILLPAIIIGLGVVFTSGHNWRGFIPASLLTVAYVFVAAIARDCGLKAQKKLKEKRGALPATALLRWTDETLSASIKRDYHTKIAAQWSDLALPTKTQEQNDRTTADNLYDLVIERLIQKTQNKDEYPNVFRELGNYGFLRNLYGLKNTGLLIAFLTLLALLTKSYLPSGSYLPPPLISLASTVIILHMLALIYFVRPDAVWRVGQRYGRELLKAI